MQVEKVDVITSKLNNISKKFAEKLNNANDLIIVGDELDNDTETVVNEIKNLPVSDTQFNLELLPEIMNLENMMHDVRYIRETLRENTELGRKLLRTISGEIEFEPNAELLASYSQLSATLTENMRLFLSCYKDISNVLINISKLTQQNNVPKNLHVNNIQINSDESKIRSTAELIKQLSELKE